MTENIQEFVTTGVKVYNETYRCQWRIENVSSVIKNEKCVDLQWFEFETGKATNLLLKWKFGLKTVKGPISQNYGLGRSQPVHLGLLLSLLETHNKSVVQAQVELEPVVEADKQDQRRGWRPVLDTVKACEWMIPGEQREIPIRRCRDDIHNQYDYYFRELADHEDSVTFIFKINVSHYVRTSCLDKAISE